MVDARILPDPEAPHGGRVLLSLPAGSVANASVRARVQSGYSQLWLAPTDGENELIGIGEANWQADAHAYGPYPVTRERDRDIVRIGPEIVNKIEEYAPVTLAIGGLTIAINWPDDVMPRVGAALIGGVAGTAKPAQTDTRQDRLVGHKPEGPEQEEGGVELAPIGETDAPHTAREAPEDFDDEREDEEEGQPGSRKGLFGGLVALILASIGLGYFFFGTELDPDPSPPSAAINENPEDPCSLPSLRATARGFAGANAGLASCVGSVSAETAFALLEAAALDGDGDALMMFGTLYDAEVTDLVFETRLSVTFGDNAALAAEYYAQARDRGVREAETRLSRVCETLAAQTDTLSRGAFDDFCS